MNLHDLTVCAETLASWRTWFEPFTAHATQLICDAMPASGVVRALDLAAVLATQRSHSRARWRRAAP